MLVRWNGREPHDGQTAPHLLSTTAVALIPISCRGSAGMRCPGRTEPCRQTQTPPRRGTGSSLRSRHAMICSGFAAHPGIELLDIGCSAQFTRFRKRVTNANLSHDEELRIAPHSMRRSRKSTHRNLHCMQAFRKDTAATTRLRAGSPKTAAAQIRRPPRRSAPASGRPSASCQP